MGPPNSEAPIFTAPTTDFRLVRKGHTMFAFVSPDDGKHWDEATRFETFGDKKVLVGITASNTSSQEFKAEFTGLKFTPLAED